MENDKEIRIFYNPKTGEWEGEERMLARMRRRHVRGVCVSILLITFGNLIMQAGGRSRWAMGIGGLIITSGMVNAFLMARENLKFAKKR